MLRLAIAPAVLTLGTAFPTQAAVFRCASGDVACLVDAINQSNTNGERNTIRLEAGIYALSAIDNDTNGPNGLPSIAGHIIIRGKGAAATSIMRASSAPLMRLLHVGRSGQLTVDGVTLTGGGGRGVLDIFRGSGAGIFNDGGVVNITKSVVSANESRLNAGGVDNSGGLVNITESALMNNRAGAGGAVWTHGAGNVVRITRSRFTGNIANQYVGGAVYAEDATVVVAHTSFNGNFSIVGAVWGSEHTTLVVVDSSFISNRGEHNAAIAVSRGALAFVTNTTFAFNRSVFPLRSVQGSAIDNGGTLLLVNSTLADNGRVGTTYPPPGALASRAGATTVVANTIVARHADSGGVSHDCEGPITSLGHNFISDTTGCSVALQATERTGEPGLGALSDNGSPGNGHIPLVAGSPAIDAGNDFLCSRRDQIGNRRIRPCDIGAIEFQSKDRGRAKLSADDSAGRRADLSKLLSDLEHVASELQWVTAHDADALKEIGSLVDQATRLARGRSK